MNRQKVKRGLVWAMMLVAISIMAVSGYRLWQIQKSYDEGEQHYEALADKVRSAPIKSQQDTAAPEGELPPLFVDGDELQAVNQDAVAWLYSPNGIIDYPVMKATDYSWYLYHLPDGSYNACGTPFLDYHNPDDFSGSLSIIYAHHMKSGSMFGSLVNYKKQEYFDEYPYMYLNTLEGEQYRIEMLYGCVIAAGEWRSRAFMYEENLTSLLAFAKHNTTFNSAVTYNENDRFVVMSTCSYEFDDARYFTVGVLRPIT